jgi:hypothetical protein
MTKKEFKRQCYEDTDYTPETLKRARIVEYTIITISAVLPLGILILIFIY